MNQDFLIGPAATLESILTLMADDVKVESGNVKLMLYGAPGVGKTELCNRLAHRLTGGSPFAVESINGKELDIAKVKALRQAIPYGNIFAEWSVLIVNEIDRASNDAQVLMLTLLDELPPRFAILVTSNLNLSTLSDRFQTRFMSYKVTNPSSEDIEFLVSQRYPGLHDGEYQSIALGSGGNVRAALQDAKAAHLVMRSAKAKRLAKANPEPMEAIWD